MSKFIQVDYEDKNGFFSPRGDLDGDRKEEFANFDQFIGLVIEKDEYLLPISDVAGILMLTPITYVPRSPNYVEGVINLRGTIIPTVNLRKLAGLKKGLRTPNTRIIIVKSQDFQIGFIVDGITYVQALSPNEIEQENLPFHNNGIDVITRIAKKKDTIYGIIDTQKILDIYAPITGQKEDAA